MASKKELLKNIQRFSPEEIADAIRSGVVTLYELGHDTEGQFTPLLKKRVKDILSRPAEATEHTVTPPSLQNDSRENVDKQILIDDVETAPEEDKVLVNIPPFIVPSTENANSNQNDGNESSMNQTGSKQKPKMFRNPFSFKGRIRRLEYGISFIIMCFVYIFMGIIVSAIDATKSEGLFAIYLILLILFYWFAWAQGAKRCHDRGNSGWYQIIPFYGFWMLFADGDKETNEYGECPK